MPWKLSTALHLGMRYDLCYAYDTVKEDRAGFDFHFCISLWFLFSSYSSKESASVADKTPSQERNSSDKVKTEKHSSRHENNVEETSKSRSEDETKPAKATIRKEPLSPSKQDKVKTSSTVKTERFVKFSFWFKYFTLHWKALVH